MKTYWSGGLALCVWGSVQAAEPVRVPAAAPEGSAMAIPVVMDEAGPKTPPRLRDLLRQSSEGSSNNAQPYRLSPEERQRLREQLRQQPWPVQTSK